MTEYTTSSEAIREYMSSHQRTAYWVQAHANDTEFYSPSVPPTVLEGYAPSSPPSEVGSSHSNPPKMMLRYPDGRPDIPIPHADDQRSSTKTRASQPHHSHSRSRSGSQSQNRATSPLARSHSRHRERSPLPAQEEIRILPSHDDERSRSSSSRHPRSKSLPRASDLHPQEDVPVPMMPPTQQKPHSKFSSLGRQSSTRPPVPRGPTPTQHHLPQSRPVPWHAYAGDNLPHGGPQKSMPPSIIYAPSHHSRLHYSPPAIYNHPPQKGPNGMIYSHSAPVNKTQYNHKRQVPHPSAGGPSSQLMSVEERRLGRADGSRRDRAQSLSVAQSSRAKPISPSSSSSSLADSRGSEGTYYVLPNAGQKVLIITPSRDPSIATATSTTRSPTSPRSGSFKKPFFQRLLSLAAGKFSSAGSAKGSSGSGRRLQRRHSTGGTVRFGPAAGTPGRQES